MRNRGFTLIELMMTIVVLGVLAGISIQTFRDARARAFYAVNIRNVDDAKKAIEAAFTNPDASYPAANYSQIGAGTIADAAVKPLLPGFVVSPNTKFSVEYDPACVTAVCVAEFLESRHCHGEYYTNWTRFGDGETIQLDRVSGAGC